MTKSTPLTPFRDAIDALGQSDHVTSLYVPRPSIETGGEKWRILRKNLLTALEEKAPKAERIYAALEGLENHDFRGLGIAFFESPTAFRTMHLIDRPIAILTTEAQPFLLPALADHLDRQTAWALALDKDEPKLYHYRNGEITDETHRLDAPSYEEIEHRRYVQDDILFHQGARGSVGGHQGPAIFHALGISQPEEEEKTDIAYYRELISALDRGLPAQLETLHVFADPHTGGRFVELVHADDFTIEHHNAAGDALAPERIAKALGGQLEPVPEIGEVTSDRNAVHVAAHRGQVADIYIGLDHALLEPKSSGAPSEHVRLRTNDELLDARAINETVMSAVMNGANVTWLPRPSHGDVFAATLRWSGADSAA